MTFDEVLMQMVREVVREELRTQAPPTATPVVRVLTTEQAAEIAEVKAKTVREWISSGKLQAGYRGQKRTIQYDDLMRFLGGDPPEKTPGRALVDSLRRPAT